MKTGATRAPVVTSWSTINALGATTHEVMRNLRAGAPGLSPPPPGTGLETRCGTVTADLPLLEGKLAHLDTRNNRFVQQALAELAEPLEAARTRWGPARIGICVGSSTASMDELERHYVLHARTNAVPPGSDVVTRGSADGLALVLRGLTELRGPTAIVSNACASSGKVFASAKRWLEAGVVDAVLVGGADSLCQLTLRGFRSLGLLSEEACRPFSAERRGIHIGEGAAFALLEREGEGPRLLGVGESADAHHMTTPDPDGGGASLAMRAALSDARVSPSEVGYVNAHGTGTRFNDAMEARAIRAVLGAEARPIVVSTKGYVGHTLGAAGAIEAVFVLEALRGGWTPASAGASPVDPEIDLDVSTECRDVRLRVALSNSFAFGGINVSLVFGAAT